jgi:hypothetical protein
MVDDGTPPEARGRSRPQSGYVELYGQGLAICGVGTNVGPGAPGRQQRSGVAHPIPFYALCASLAP